MSSKPFAIQQPAQARGPHPCCVPSVERAERLAESRHYSARRRRAAKGSTEGMLNLDGGRFLMGTEYENGFPADGEGPVREVFLDPFYIDPHPVTAEQFQAFIKATGYVTEAERFEWSFVFHAQVGINEGIGWLNHWLAP